MMTRIVMIVIVVAEVFLLAASAATAADLCTADTNGDCKVDLTDLVTMKSEFMKPDCEACSPPYPAPVEKTGQTNCYDTDGNPRECANMGEDGEYQKGVALPNPRFTDNENGTLTDSLTGLIWLKNANCFGPRLWNNALADCYGLENGECGLIDGSVEGDWRLPNRFELESLLDMGNYAPALPSGHPFINVQSFNYWSSTTHAYYTNFAWEVDMDYGILLYAVKNQSLFIWPVRGGQ